MSFSLASIFLHNHNPETMKNLVFQEPEVGAPEYASSSLRYAWQSIRTPVIIPLLKLAVILCSAMSIMLFVERVGMAAVILIVKVLRKKKYTKYNLDAMKQNLERSKRYPMVLIQIPMYNEKEVTLLFNCKTLHRFKFLVCHTISMHIYHLIIPLLLVSCFYSFIVFFAILCTL